MGASKNVVVNKQDRLYRWHVLVDLMPPRGAVRGAEIGVWKGECSRHLLDMMPQLTLYMVDRWCPDSPGGRYHASGDSKAVATQGDHDVARAMAEAVAKSRSHRAIIMAGESLDMAALVDDASLDFVFIDGDHTIEGCRADIIAWRPKIKPGGVLAGHDYRRYGVAEAVRGTLGGVYHLSHDDTWWHRVRKGMP